MPHFLLVLVNFSMAGEAVWFIWRCKSSGRLLRVDLLTFTDISKRAVTYLPSNLDLLILMMRVRRSSEPSETIYQSQQRQ